MKRQQTVLSCGTVRTASRLVLGIALIAGGISNPVFAQNGPTDFADMGLEELMAVNVLSINALGTHTHLAGEVMVGYRYMFMGMRGNRDGTRAVSADAVLQDYMVTPTEMTMQMHMVELMYAPSDKLTLMAMLPYRQLSMDHLTTMGTGFTTESKGFGDVTLVAHYTVLGDVRRTNHRLLLDARMITPTGSIDADRRVPAAPGASTAETVQQLPYPMQLGSGTFDLDPGLTYLGESRRLAWMLHSAATIRLGSNSRDYRLGNSVRFAAWGAWAVREWLSPSVRVDGVRWGNIDGADPELTPTMVTTADPSKRGGTNLDIAFALSVYVPSGAFIGQRFSIEASLPVYQSLDGPQLQRSWGLTSGWTWTF